jgi:hypothetical protein
VNYDEAGNPLSDTRISIFDVNGNIVGIDGEPVTIGTNNNNKVLIIIIIILVLLAEV